ncbi:fumarylacetoacetate (FAA) hydrolase [Moraxella macacae 0408225]|uniref:Fumarylacetoacetate (FAA) hydrolase n=1 Tax=Moraxella macacae 0408225 TaxID=1230338 RepID=L2F8L5_9GAMM|nr:fumarylacetoacetate hydrolase family protein [Moraxella macacae]ELA09387.1 fumarylacetoacetate (FAA) hydrolase [Moraxella macacae 0408225]
MSYIFNPSKTVGLPILHHDKLFPVHRVYCVGRNYAEHAKEMGSDPKREPPFFFCKHSDAQSIIPIANNHTVHIPYPTQTHDFHYEIELVVALASGGKNIKPADAMQCVFGYAIGLDMTRRDLQNQMKQQGRPWEAGKAFDFAAPIGEICPISYAGEIENARICLKVNGKTVQQGNIHELIWNIAQTIGELSKLFELCAGDLIFTGTPKGVGSVVSGDVMMGEITGLPGICVVVD